MSHADNFDLPPAQTIRAANAADLAHVGRVLGSAFSNDPVMNWISPNWYMGEKLFSMEAATLYLPRGIVHINASNTGAAMWLPPDIRPTTSLQWQALSVFGQMLLRAGISGISRGHSTETVMAKNHPHEPHYYLHAIGAHLNHQGEGIGSALLKAGVAVADEAGMPAYLESSNPRNNPLYERFGFEVTGEHTFPEGGPTVWFMWREARTPANAGG